MIWSIFQYFAMGLMTIIGMLILLVCFVYPIALMINRRGKSTFNYSVQRSLTGNNNLLEDRIEQLEALEKLNKGGSL